MLAERIFAELALTILLWIGKKANVGEETLKRIETIRTSIYVGWKETKEK